MRNPETESPSTAAAPAVATSGYRREEIVALLAVLGSFLLLAFLFGVGYHLSYDWVEEQNNSWEMDEFWWQDKSESGWERYHFLFEKGPLFFGGALVATACVQYLSVLMWAALFRGSNLLRITLGALVAVLCTVWLAGWSNPEQREMSALLSAATIAPLFLYFFLQLPFWGMRWWFGWRVLPAGEETNTPRRRSFKLLHLFAWTMYLAAPLAMLRVLMDAGAMRDVIGFMLVVSLLVAGMTLGAFVLGFLYLWVTLTSRRPWRAWLVTGLLLLVLILVGLLLVQADDLWDAWESQLRGNPWAGRHLKGILWDSLCMALGGTLGAELCLLPVMLACRRRQWRLVRGGKGAA